MANHLNFLQWLYCLFFQGTGPHTWEKSQNCIRGIKNTTLPNVLIFKFLQFKFIQGSRASSFEIEMDVSFHVYIERCPASTAGPRFKQTLYQKCRLVQCEPRSPNLIILPQNAFKQLTVYYPKGIFTTTKSLSQSLKSNYQSYTPFLLRLIEWLWLGIVQNDDSSNQSSPWPRLKWQNSCEII